MGESMEERWAKVIDWLMALDSRVEELEDRFGCGEP